MKKKFFSIFLSGFIFFQTCINSYANPALVLPLLPEIAPEILVSLATVATGVGFQLNNEESIFSLGRMFVDSCKSKGKDFVKDFKKSVAIDAKGVTHIGKEFLNDCKTFFDDTFSKSSDIVGNYSCLNGVPILNSNSVITGGRKYIPMVSKGFGLKIVDGYVCKENGEKFFHNGYWTHYDKDYKLGLTIIKTPSECRLALIAHNPNAYDENDRYFATGTSMPLSELNELNKSYSVPIPNSYDWGKLKVGQNVDSGTVGMYVPGNISSLPKVKDYSDVISKPGILNPPYDLPKDRTVTIPKVSDMPIDIGKSIAIPNVGVITNEGSMSNTSSMEKTWDIFPSWGEGINFKPLTQINFADKFPFCLASDLKETFELFDVKSKSPIFEVPIFTEKIKIDLTEFNKLFNIIRFFIMLFFIVCIINITRRMIG